MTTRSPGAAAPTDVKRGSIAKAVAIVVVTLTVGIAGAEAALRVFGYYRPPDFPPPPVRSDLFVGDSAFGYRLWPLTRTCMRYPGNTHRMVALISNADGFASSRNLGEPDDRTRILVIGDSFTMGLGVNEGTRYTEVLERLEPRWRVDNMGMMGWGLDLMVRALEAKGKKAKPDVVVLAVYTDDLSRLAPRFVGAAGIPYKKFALVDGKLVDTPPYELTFVRRLHLAELWRIVQEKRGGTTVRNRYPLNAAILDKFVGLTKELGATPVVLFLPGRSDNAEDKERRGFLREWTESRNVVYRDLTDALHGEGVERTYIPSNFHWNELGHEVAGRALHQLLARDVLAAPGTGRAPTTTTAPPWSGSPGAFCSDRGDGLVVPKP